MARTKSRTPAAIPVLERDADLEAAIAEDPDDAGRYLVYADWLQLRGDPRGLLIVLQQAAQEHPRRRARAAAAASQLEEHRHALLGRLEPYTRQLDAEIELDWFMGFIRGARLWFERDERLLEGLGCLLASPSSAFLQELVILPHKGNRPVDAGAIAALLLEQPPRLLRRLEIGKPGAWKIPKELRARLPRLARQPSEVWAEVRAKLAQPSRQKIELDAVRLPALEPRRGAGSVDVKALLAGLKAELGKGRPLGLLAALPQVFTRDSLDRFAVAMAAQWLESGKDTAKWSFDALGPLGGDRAAAFLGEHLAAWSHLRCARALDHLSVIGSDAAVWEIAALALRPRRHRSRREIAQVRLDALAAARGLAGAAALLDRTCPAAPSTRALDAQRWWLESLVVSGHRIAAPVFLRGVIEHPVRRPLAETLLWGEYAGPRLIRMFRVDGGGVPRRLDGSVHELQQGHGIGLVHPAELSPDELGAVRGVFAGVPQAVPQLERPVFRLTDEERSQTALVRFARRRVGFSAIRDALEARDWFVYEQYDAGGAESFGKDLPRDGAVAVATLGDTMGAIGEVVIGELRLDRLHDVTISELLWDLEVAHGWTPARAAAAPIVERAKSGRSKCVVCGAAIARDSLRIGVKRMIETPAFRDYATVWLHPQCREGVPELEGEPGLDELLR